MQHLRNYIWAFAGLFFFSSLKAQETRTQLPNGWFLTPAGRSVPLSSDLPLNMALAPDGVHVAVGIQYDLFHQTRMRAKHVDVGSYR